MDRAAAHHQAVANRRAFRLPGYVTYAEAGFEGDWTCPIQITSGNRSGPVIVTKDWLDAPSAIAHRETLLRLGYLPEMPFNAVLDRALARAGLARSDIYITPVFKLMPSTRSYPIPMRDIRASFEAITRFELIGSRPIAAGKDAIRALTAAGIDHIPVAHPSARGFDFETRAEALASAFSRACSEMTA
ncbi:hypothetical protein [Paragemmobacter ruber]|uniref:Uracil-DNA glycosylase-like domain-containing protein n=1 Tax=Paragemmobacter ruber TaxID=1985673 RepID=A0ABW9Y206_9RHOB|nr:hypothetical protein [Rhodobacter ruber]NBE06538.1 hypothetical protein [Rhodobacter ruber]